MQMDLLEVLEVEEGSTEELVDLEAEVAVVEQFQILDRAREVVADILAELVDQ